MNWSELFDYRDGQLFWVVDRPSSHFLCERTSRFWHTRYAGKSAGTLCGGGYLQVSVKGNPHSVHRVIYELLNGPVPSGAQIDHVNGIKTDNRIENLRLATRSENSCNRKPNINNTSGFKGVHWDKKSSVWVAQIQVDRKRKRIGCFNTKEEAYIAYCAASAELHGKFRRVA